LGNQNDYLPTRTSYKLNLRGPSVEVQTACSTSLVAIHLARQSLLNGECDMALAGGALVNVPQREGYVYDGGGMVSPEGRCRTFDARAAGTVFSGGGVGVLVLKRLETALEDGDQIYAVIKGSAIGNDGGVKVGFTAPSVSGQAQTIAEALAVADLDPDTISYVEAHGTGTPLGDPIEIAALTQVYRRYTQRKGYCAIGTAKTNVGHLGAVAGVTGVIKTALSLKHQLLPGILHFETPNPKIDFANSPFFVNTELRRWETQDGIPRRAGVSAFGVGGTNAHAILEEGPPVVRTPSSRPYQLLLLSARTPTALTAMANNLAAHLRAHPQLDLADVAYTLQVGRHGFQQRRVLVCRDTEEAIAALASESPASGATMSADGRARGVVFMFSGQGAQYVAMSRDLYNHEPVFRAAVDRCAELLTAHLGLDLRDILFPADDAHAAATAELTRTAIAQPALFTIEYATAELLMSWGIEPQAMIGHSVGEYVAACVAGVFGLEDGLALIAARGRLMQSLPGGAMLSVALSTAELAPYLSAELALAASNGPAATVVAGPFTAIESLETRLADDGIACRRLHTSHAFHSAMMDPILASFQRRVAEVRLQPPTRPYISNVSGTWITAEEATSPDYWARHLRQAVRFYEGLRTLAEDADQILLEVGPGRTLSTLARQAKLPIVHALPTLRHPQDAHHDYAFLLNTLGRLWAAGARLDWQQVADARDERRRRVSLPGYPSSASATGLSQRRSAALSSSSPAGPAADIRDWFLCAFLASYRAGGRTQRRRRAALPALHRRRRAQHAPQAALLACGYSVTTVRHRSASLATMRAAIASTPPGRGLRSPGARARRMKTLCPPLFSISGAWSRRSGLPTMLASTPRRNSRARLLQFALAGTGARA
ncbi:type I polyketide synthase, partial [Candidatus Gracilibacteria bacterium]|nr:type I polyketide synthase [Candidatus Gracilibacteria bacterium]